MRVKATFVVDLELWKEFRKLAIDEDKTYSELLEQVMRRRLKK